MAFSINLLLLYAESTNKLLYLLPGMGSEQGMGWNWITSLAKTGVVELFVISEGGYMSQIEYYLRSEKRKVKSPLLTTLPGRSVFTFIGIQ